MAPSAVETTIVTDRTFQAPTAKLVGGIGAYKDVTPVGYEKEAEANAKVFDSFFDCFL